MGRQRGPLQLVTLSHGTRSQHHQKLAGVQGMIDPGNAVKSA